MVDDRFRKFVMDHRASINDMVAEHWQLIDEHVSQQLRLGFERCAEPCFMSCPRPENEETVLAIIKLMLLAIKKRYYAFPDKHVVAVDQEIFFEKIAPRLVGSGLLGNSLEPFVLLFNAGENLRELSRAFYEIMFQLVDIVACHLANLQSIIHVAAWLAGDAKRRAHALKILVEGRLPPEVLSLAAFKGKLALSAITARPVASQLHDIITSSLASDPWLSPAIISEDPTFLKLASIAIDGKSAVPGDVARSLATRAASKAVKNARSVKFLGKAGSYEGFGGMFDSPPVVVGIPSEASLIARTASGRLFHVDYGGMGARIHVLGTTTCKTLAHARDIGLIGLDQDDSIVTLQDGHVVGSITREFGNVLAAAGRRTAFFLDQGTGIAYKARNDAVSKIEIKDGIRIISIAVIDDDRLAIVTSDKNQREWNLEEVSTTGPAINLASLHGKSLVAACDGVLACLQSDGTILVLDSSGKTTTSVPSFIDPATVTSFHVTAREIITTHAFTHAIHFHGPPV
ncbi:MAG: hypothetical protein Q6353_000670 [Candidatus Sigynarchaeum springense]